MERYDHGGDIYGNSGITLDFSVNTNPLGMPHEIRQALTSRVDEYTRYPDPYCRELRAAVALRESVPEDWTLCGNGAADLIYRLCYAIKPRSALVCAPSFSEYERALEQVGCRIIRHFLTPQNHFALLPDMEGRLVPGVDLLFLCNPNNPTGRLIPENLMARILAKARQNHTRVVVDECFMAFTDGKSCKTYLKDMPELAVLNAFTKIYAIAGLRLGYLLTSDTELLKRTADAAQCWSVSYPAQIAGIAALTCTDWQEKTYRFVSRERDFLAMRLKELGITVFPGDANFLLLRCETPLYEPLLKKGILIRSCENFEGLDSSYSRVGIKTRTENMLLIKAIKEIIDG